MADKNKSGHVELSQETLDLLASSGNQEETRETTKEILDNSVSLEKLQKYFDNGGLTAILISNK